MTTRTIRNPVEWTGDQVLHAAHGIAATGRALHHAVETMNSPAPAIKRITAADLTVATQRAPSDAELADLLFAFAVCKHVKSNAIVYAKGRATVGIGAGQMSRVDSAKFGAMKAVLPLANCVAASDAFFPFADGLETVAAAGATAVIQPGGSVRDNEVIAAADGLGIAMVFTGIRHFRH